MVVEVFGGWPGGVKRGSNLLRGMSGNHEYRQKCVWRLSDNPLSRR